jgi:glycosyltransferase involved in cell wall biosynthesis
VARNRAENIAASRPARAVWLDARGLQQGFKAHGGRGIGTYAAALVTALDALAAPGRLGCIVERGAEMLQPVPRGRVVEAPRALPGRGRLATQIHQHLQLGAWLSARRPAAVHFPAQTDAPVLTGVRTIVTVHDVVLHRHGAWYATHAGDGLAARASRARFRTMRLLERLAIAQASRVIVPSRVTAREVEDTLGVERARMTVIPLAADARFTAAAAPRDASVRARLQLPERYVLHVGGSDARKRLPDLVAAFDALARDDATLGLVLAGPTGDAAGSVALRRAIDVAAARHRIVLTGVVADEDLPAVYRGASVVALATRHEGFGLPVLEAFGCGVPVVATAADAIAEVAGDAALLVPVDEPDALGPALARVLGEAALAASLREHGLARATQYRWSVAAAETLTVYEEVAGLDLRTP